MPVSVTDIGNGKIVVIGEGKSVRMGRDHGWNAVLEGMQECFCITQL